MIKVEEFKIPNEIYLEKFDIHVRPYLLVDEIIDIGERMLMCDSVVLQECSLMIDVMRYCTDISEEYLTLVTEEEIEEGAEDTFLGFDFMIQSGLWEAVSDSVPNIMRVWEYVADKEDMSKAGAYFIRNNLSVAIDEFVKILSKWEKKMPKGKQWNELLSELPKQLGDALGVMKDDGNAELINNAMKMNTVAGNDK